MVERNKLQNNFVPCNFFFLSLFYEPEDFYISPKALEENPNGGVAVARGWKVERIDPYKRIAYLEGGHEITYEKCLLATGTALLSYLKAIDAHVLVQNLFVVMQLLQVPNPKH